jgi:hypothetical protein
MRPVLAFFLLVPAMLVGCDNSCQQVCDVMARYAEDCGVTVSSDEVQDCKDRQAGAASRDDRGTCRTYNGRSAMEDQLDCEELSAYWTDAPSSPAEE